MNIQFKTRKMQKNCSDERAMIKEWGTQIAKLLKKRLMEIRAVDNLSDLHKIPQARCHILKGDRKGQFSVDLKHPFRLVFLPNHEPIPTNDEGGYDLMKINSVIILEVTDYHGK